MSENLEELFKLAKVANRSGVHRCSICNTVNSEYIETNLGDYRPYQYFVNDPKDPSHFICGECDDSIRELQMEYEI